MGAESFARLRTHAKYGREYTPYFAEAERFELSRRFPVCRLSKAVH